MEGFKLCSGARWHLLIDAPWGWAVSRHATTAVRGAVVVTDNPCPEYKLDLLEQEPAALLSGVSLPDIVRTLEELEAGQKQPLPKLSSPLTPVERLTLRLAARGCDNKVIAKARNTGEGTVKNSLQVVFQKLGFESRVQLAHYYGNWHALDD
ncbi:hypothetical protein BH24DEI1_BH24DEI1_07370 [soil metagenome]